MSVLTPLSASDAGGARKSYPTMCCCLLWDVMVADSQQRRGGVVKDTLARRFRLLAGWVRTPPSPRVGAPAG